LNTPRALPGLRPVLISMGLAIAGYLAFALWGQWSQVMASVARLSRADVAIVLSLSLLNYGLRFLRWHRYLQRLGHAVPWRADLAVYLAGFAFTTTPGKAGEAVRSLFLRRHAVPYPHSLAVLLAERVGDLLAVAALAALGLSHRGGIWTGLLAVAICLLLGLWTLRWLGRQHAWLERLHGRWAQLAQGLIETIRHSGTLFTPSLLFGSVLLGLVAWAAEGVGFHYLLALFGHDPGWLAAISIYALSMLAGALSFLPGGLGGAELTMVTLLVMSGSTNPAAVTVTLLIRLATLWFAVAIGLAALRTAVSGYNHAPPH